MRFALLLAILPGLVLAQPGTLDPSFSTDGWVTTAVSSAGSMYDQAYAVTVQPDGKIIAVGNSTNVASTSVAVLRYLPDGTLDPTFDGDGIVTTYLNATVGIGNDVLVQADGKILVAGRFSQGTVVVRYLPNGALDNTFSGDGSANFEFGTGSGGKDMAVQTNGRIVVAGYAHATYRLFNVVRYTTAGELDDSFDGNGQVTTQVLPFEDAEANAVVLQADGKIVLGGHVGFDRLALVRYNTNGALDASFGTGGIAVHTIPGYTAQMEELLLQPDGKFVGVGTANDGNEESVVLARFTSDGELDNTFGTGGYVVSEFGPGADRGEAVLLQPNGKILVAGRSLVASNYHMLVARYTADGELDAAFGVAGSATAMAGVDQSEAHAIALQPDGRIVLAGMGNYPGDFSVARFISGIPIGMEEVVEDAGSLHVQPNPAFETTTVHLSLRSAGEVSCELLDAAGKVVHTYFGPTRFGSGPCSFPIDLTAVPPGAYTLRMALDHGALNARFVKE